MGLIAKGLATGRTLLADAGWTLLIVSRPLVLLHLLLTVALASLLAWLCPATASRAFLVMGVSSLAVYAVYFAVGIAAVGISARRAGYLLTTPLVLARLAIIALKAGMSRQTNWVRTPRS